jgi:hypothetical protein
MPVPQEFFGHVAHNRNRRSLADASQAINSHSHNYLQKTLQGRQTNDELLT